MSNVQEIEQAIRQLTPEELTAFRLWFAEYDAAVWDKQIEADSASGKLDALAEEALKDHANGRSSEL